MKRPYVLKQLVSVLFLVCMMIFAVLMNRAMVNAEETESGKPDNGLPVIYLNIDESQGTIEDMTASKDHSVYCYGTLSIEVPEGFHYSDFPDLSCESFADLEMNIRGRGNSTWAHQGKKPFKIKLDKKEDLFGLGKNKHWVLVANAFDETLLRDRITAWLGDQLGFEFTPRGVPADVVMIGSESGTQYLGSYYFSENVRVDTNRLEIDELSEEMVDEPEITGGYLMQNPTQLAEDSPDRFKTSRGVEWATHTPSFDTSDDGYVNPAQQTYIQNHMQKVEDALFDDGTGYREYMDLESAAKYWLMNEASKNSDGYGTGSTYIYKKRDTDGAVGKIYWGPLWDFDYGYDRVYNREGFTPGGEWVVPMFCDREEGGFVEEVRKHWPVLKQAMSELIADGGIIDQYYEETRASAEQDRKIWHPDETEYNWRKEVEELKDWIRKRLAWMDENFDLVDDLVHKVKFMADDELYALEFKPAGEMIHGNEPHPDKEGYIFTGWMSEDGSIIGYNTPVEKDMVLNAQYIREEDATHGEDIAFRKNSDIVQFSVHYMRYTIDYEVIPVDAIDKEVHWSVSDESFASVDQDGVVSFAGPGEVTVTAKLNSGTTREFRLKIIQEDTPAPDSIYPLEDTVYMHAGDQKPFV
ncbi:MAG: CotH kinase family protein, partial [Solobacterium sp.]|nr:CotH kinase family protein [Solobacterium sp.]